MATHKQRRGDYYTSGKSGDYTVHTPDGVPFAKTFKQEHGKWPVFDLSGEVLVAEFTKGDTAISIRAERAIKEAIEEGLIVEDPWLVEDEDEELEEADA